MNLYTFIMEYCGGTYISQVESACEKSASLEWASRLNTKHIAKFGEKTKQYLIEEINKETPTAIENTKNVWLLTALIRSKVAFINIIQTEK